MSYVWKGAYARQVVSPGRRMEVRLSGVISTPGERFMRQELRRRSRDERAGWSLFVARRVNLSKIVLIFKVVAEIENYVENRKIIYFVSV